MPDIPELIRVNAVLHAESGKAKKQADLKTQLKQSLKGVGHESVDVRKHALSKLKQLLHDNQVNMLHNANSAKLSAIRETLLAFSLESLNRV